MRFCSVALMVTLTLTRGQYGTPPAVWLTGHYHRVQLRSADEEPMTFVACQNRRGPIVGVSSAWRCVGYVRQRKAPVRFIKPHINTIKQHCQIVKIKVSSWATRAHLAGTSQGISASLATAHNGMMWMAQNSAASDYCHAGTQGCKNSIVKYGIYKQSVKIMYFNKCRAVIKSIHVFHTFDKITYLLT